MLEDFPLSELCCDGGDDDGEIVTFFFGLESSELLEFHFILEE